MSGQIPDFDLAAVVRFADGRVPGLSERMQVSKFATGQSNPTFLLRNAEVAFVLRRKPLGTLLKSAHAVEREFRVQQALQGTDVPVPEMFLLCEDSSILGAPFYIMSHVDGRNFDDPRLGDLPHGSRSKVMEEMCRVLAALHSVDVEAVGLSDYGPPGDYFARQLTRWSAQYEASRTEDLAEMDALIQGLGDALPKDDGQRTLVHGDYRLDNLIFSPDGHSCRAVLDWELSTLGHPYADLAGVIMQWQMPPGAEGRGLSGVDRDAEGLMQDQAFVDRYCSLRGIAPIENFGFFLAFSFFRMGAILQGVKKRALDGNASNPEHGLRLGQHLPRFARAGLAALSGAAT